MIIEYNDKYINDIKDLLEELQDYIVSLDKEKNNIKTIEYRDKYYEKTIEEISKYNGKMLLYLDNDKVIGLVVGIVNNDKIDTYDFKAEKRGRITELVVSSKYGSNGIGKLLLNSMETYLYSIDCKDILLGVFAYNDKAHNFYLNNGYHNRLVDMIKVKND